MLKRKSSPISFEDQQAMSCKLRGVALSLFHCLIRLTRGGTRPIKVSAAALAHRIHYSERQVWRGLRKLSDILVVRRRFGFIKGKWSKIANGYRIRRSLAQRIPVPMPGRQFKPKPSIYDIRVRTPEPRAIYDSSIWDGPAPPKEALARFYARVGITSRC